MGEFSEFGLEQQARVVEKRQARRVVDAGLEAALGLGHRYGEDEAGRRREVGVVREQRVARAVRYARGRYERMLAAAEEPGGTANEGTVASAAVPSAAAASTRSPVKTNGPDWKKGKR